MIFSADANNEVNHSKPVRTNTYPIPDDIRPLLKKRARTKEDQIYNAKLLHPMKPGCTSVCPRKCCTKFTEEQRRNIYETFWKLDRKNRNKWVSKLLMQEPIERRTNADKQSRRLRSLYYHLPTSSDCTADNVRVCKRFFLATIGHSYSQIIGQITNSPEFRDQFMPPLLFEKRSWSRYVKKKDRVITRKNNFSNSIPCEKHDVTTLLENSPTLPDIPIASEAVDDVEQETLFKSKYSSVTDHVSSDSFSTQIPIDMKAKIDDSWSNPPSDSADEEDEDVMDEETSDVEHVPPEGLYHHNQFNVHVFPRLMKGMAGCFTTALGRQPTFSNSVTLRVVYPWKCWSK